MSVSKTPDGKWRVQCWFVDWKGVRHHKCKRGFERKKDAEIWELQFKSKTQTETITMSRLIDEFKKSLLVQLNLGNIKQSTYELKLYSLEHFIGDYFGDADASKINAQNINEWLSHLQTSSVKCDRLSSGTIGLVRNILSQIFDYGIVNLGIKENPVKLASMPKQFTNDKRVKIWSVDEYKTFYFSLEKNIYRVLFNVMYFGGLRIGETVMLTPNDINGNVISIVKTFNRAPSLYTKRKSSTTKTKSSERQVLIPQQLAEQLQRYMNSLIGLKPTDRIFDISIGTISQFLTRRAKKLGLPHISPHNLRHSYASLIFNQTHNAAMCAKQLGHKNAKIFLDTYAHMMPNEDSKAVAILDDFVIV